MANASIPTVTHAPPIIGLNPASKRIIPINDIKLKIVVSVKSVITLMFIPRVFTAANPQPKVV